MDPEAAIDWAMEKGNTTKTGQVPGGLGLKLLREFIGVNRGAIQVASDAKAAQNNSSTVLWRRKPHALPSTVVDIEINTADMRTCSLPSDSEQIVF